MMIDNNSNKLIFLPFPPSSAAALNSSAAATTVQQQQQLQLQQQLQQQQHIHPKSALPPGFLSNSNNNMCFNQQQIDKDNNNIIHVPTTLPIATTTTSATPAARVLTATTTATTTASQSPFHHMNHLSLPLPQGNIVNNTTPSYHQLLGLSPPTYPTPTHSRPNSPTLANNTNNTTTTSSLTSHHRLPAIQLPPSASSPAGPFGLNSFMVSSSPLASSLPIMNTNNQNNSHAISVTPPQKKAPSITNNTTPLTTTSAVSNKRTRPEAHPDPSTPNSNTKPPRPTKKARKQPVTPLAPLTTTTTPQDSLDQQDSTDLVADPISSPSHHAHTHAMIKTEVSPTLAAAMEKDLLRRKTHSAIEKRRRDRMNALLDRLQILVPACQKAISSKLNGGGDAMSGTEGLPLTTMGGSGANGTLHKLDIVEMTVEYVEELRRRLGMPDITPMEVCTPEGSDCEESTTKATTTNTTTPRGRAKKTATTAAAVTPAKTKTTKKGAATVKKATTTTTKKWNVPATVTTTTTATATAGTAPSSTASSVSGDEYAEERQSRVRDEASPQDAADTLMMLATGGAASPTAAAGLSSSIGFAGTSTPVTTLPPLGSMMMVPCPMTMTTQATTMVSRSAMSVNDLLC